MYIIWQVFLPYFIVTFFKYTPELQESYRECPYAHCLDSVRYVLLHLLLPISILPPIPQPILRTPVSLLPAPIGISVCWS